MLAVTLKHPWAVAIADWGKRIENRTWRPPTSAFGEWIAIHGGTPPKGNEREKAHHALTDLIRRGLAPRIALEDAIRPGIVAVAKLDCAVLDRRTAPLEGPPLLGPWFEGPIGWVFSETVTLPRPVSCRGAQGLWLVPEDVLAEVRKQFQEARTA